MIYFIKNTVTQAVKIGYSKNANKRLTHLQTATPDALILLGTIPGGLEHEAAFHQTFSQHKLHGEWFKGDILLEVLQIIAKEASNPQQTKINVIVFGDTDFTRGPCHQPENQALVFQALNELHAKTPIAWVITGGERPLDSLAWRWARQNNVEVHCYYPKWRKHGRFAGFKVGPQMLRSKFDPKLLLVFLTSKASPSTTKLIRRAEKDGIPVVTIHGQRVCR